MSANGTNARKCCIRNAHVIANDGCRFPLGWPCTRHRARGARYTDDAWLKHGTQSTRCRLKTDTLTATVTVTSLHDSVDCRLQQVHAHLQ